MSVLEIALLTFCALIAAPIVLFVWVSAIDQAIVAVERLKWRICSLMERKA